MSGRKWTKEEIKIITKLFNEGESDKEIAKIVGRSICSVKTKRGKLGLVKEKSNLNRLKDNDSIIKLMELFEKGYEYRDIIKELNCSHMTFYRKIKEIYGDNPRKRKAISNEEIEYIKHNFSILPVDQISSKIDVDRTTIYKIARKFNLISFSELNEKWTEEDLRKLARLYSEGLKIKEICAAFNGKRTEVSIATKLTKLGICNRWKNWEANELEILNMYYETDSKKCLKLIDRDPYLIHKKASDLGMIDSKYYRKHEDDFIKNNYKTMNDNQIAIELNRTRRGVKWRRQKLGLESHFYNHYGIANEAKDGTMCLSYAELDITNFFCDSGIVYEKEVLYSKIIDVDNSNRRFDWVIYNFDGVRYFVEYFGMYEPSTKNRKKNSTHYNYRKKTKKKINDLIKAGLYENCIFIFPWDLKNRSMEDIFNKVLKGGE